MPEFEKPVSVPSLVSGGLAAERILRATVRHSNRMFAGNTVGVSIQDPGVRERALEALHVLGARPIDASQPGVGADDSAAPVAFWVSDAVETGQPSGDAVARIEAAAELMPATRSLAAELAAAGILTGVRVGVSLVLEPKTAALVLALRDAGALVHVFGAVSETQTEVAAALTAVGVTVSAPQQPVPADDRVRALVDAAHAAAVLDWQPELLIDDGSHLIRLAHTRAGGAALGSLRAASEETTSGVRPLHDMHAQGELRIPVVAVNNARTKTEFDNRIGTGESCVLAVADALDPVTHGPVTHDLVANGPVANGPAVEQPSGAGSDSGSGATSAVAPARVQHGVAGTHWVVVGYGHVGLGVVRTARALGARVSVVERDSVRALAALHDGLEVAALGVLLPTADVVISATGVWHTLTESDLSLLPPHAAVAVAGGIDDEVALDELRAYGWSDAAEPGYPGVRRWWAPGALAATGIRVIADGGGVNYTFANGNPVEVMDLSFATQLAALAWLCNTLPPVGVHELPGEAEARVATAALRARGVVLDPPPKRFAGGAAQPWQVHRYRGESE